jgi:hypothetical protein
MSWDERRRCIGCGWDYYPALDRADLGVCGTCAREAGLMPRDEQTDDIDRKVRAMQRATDRIGPMV